MEQNQKNLLTIVIVICSVIFFLSICSDQGKRNQRYYPQANSFQGIQSGGPQLTDNLKSLGLTNQDLDISVLPALANEIIKDALQKGYKEEQFASYVVATLQNEVQNISAIDIGSPGNKFAPDGQADPVLIRAEPSEREGYVTFFIQIPDPEKVDFGALPQGDSSLWKEIQNSKCFDIASITVALNQKTGKGPQIQAQGSPDFYENSARRGGHMYYHQGHGGFWATYGKIMFLSYLFRPMGMGMGFGRGFGYPPYRPRPVGNMRGGRAGGPMYKKAGASRYNDSRRGMNRSRMQGATRKTSPFTSSGRRIDKSKLQRMKQESGYKARHTRPSTRRGTTMGSRTSGERRQVGGRNNRRRTNSWFGGSGRSNYGSRSRGRGSFLGGGSGLFGGK